jgi:PKD repeat protein
VSTNAPFLGFNLADSTIRGTAGAAGNYSVSVKVYLSDQTVQQDYTLSVVGDQTRGSVSIDASAVSLNEYGFTYTTSLRSEQIASVQWDFGDGNVSSDVSPVHQFAPGEHLVTLSITAENGNVLTSTYAVHVAGATPSGNASTSGNGANHSIAGAIAWGSADSILMVIALVSASVIGLLGYMGMVKGIEFPFFRFRLKP